MKAMAELLDAADLQDREERLQRREFSIRAADGDTLAVDGPYCLWAFALYMARGGFSADEIALGANHDEQLGPVAPLGGWRSEDIGSILAHPALRTSLGITRPSWRPKPRKACRDCGAVFVMDRIDVVRCPDCRPAAAEGGGE